MPESLTCGTREVQVDDGVIIPVPVGGLNLGQSNIEVREDAPVKIIVNASSEGETIGYYVVVNASNLLTLFATSIRFADGANTRSSVSLNIDIRDFDVGNPAVTNASLLLTQPRPYRK